MGSSNYVAGTTAHAHRHVVMIFEAGTPVDVVNLLREAPRNGPVKICAPMVRYSK